MTNHAPTFTSSSATGSFSENTNTTGSAALHQLTGTMNFKDSDKSDTHTTSASLGSAVLSSGSVIPASSLSHFQTAMSSQILSDSNGNGSLKWTFSDADSDFDFLAKNQSLTLTYNIKVSDNHGGFVTQTVKVTVTGTDDKPVVAVEPITIVTEQANHTLSLSPDIAHIQLDFTDVDLINTGHTASVTGVTATGNTSGMLPGSLGTAELMAFFQVDNVVKNSGSSTGVINTTFAAPDLAFDYLAAGEQLNIAYTVQLDDHAGGVSTQIVNVTVVGTNDKPVFLCGPEVAHLTESENLSPSGDLHASGDLLFTDVDLSDTHTLSTTVTASRSGGGAIPLSDAALLAAFQTSLGPDSTGHLIGDVDWNFALANAATSFLSDGEILTLTYHVAVIDPSGATATQDVTVTILGKNSLTVNAVVGVAADTAGVDTGNFIASGNVITDAGDTGDPSAVLSVSEVNGDPGNVGNFVAGTYGDLQVFSDGTYLYQAHANVDPLQLGDHPTDMFNFTVTDGLGHSHSTTLTLTVQGADDAPVITAADVLGSLVEDAGPTVGVNGGFETGDLTGWSSSGVDALGLFIGGALGNYAAELHAGGGFLEQDVATTAGQHYTLSFYVAGDAESNPTSLSVFWDGAQILAVSNASPGFTQYTFDVVGDGSDPTTQLFFDFSGSGIQFVDQVSIAPTPGPAYRNDGWSHCLLRHRNRRYPYGELHAAGRRLRRHFLARSGLRIRRQRNGRLAFHGRQCRYPVPGAGADHYPDLLRVRPGRPRPVCTQQDVTVAINGANDAPTAVNETVISDAGASGDDRHSGLGAGLQRQRSGHDRPSRRQQRRVEHGRVGDPVLRLRLL